MTDRLVYIQNKDTDTWLTTDHAGEPWSGIHGASRHEFREAPGKMVWRIESDPTNADTVRIVHHSSGGYLSLEMVCSVFNQVDLMEVIVRYDDMQSSLYQFRLAHHNDASSFNIIHNRFGVPLATRMQGIHSCYLLTSEGDVSEWRARGLSVEYMIFDIAPSA